MRGRLPIILLCLLSVWAYAARPLSCAYVYAAIPHPYGSPYSRFDYNGFTVTMGWGSTLLLAPVAIWLLMRAAGGKSGAINPFARHPVRWKTWLSIGILLLAGSPMLAQFIYMQELPLALSWPVALSSAIWFAIVACLRGVAVSPRVGVR